MKLDAEHFRSELQKILNEDGLSPEELANLSNVNRSTIYAILNGERKTSQRSVGRRVGEATNRNFKIEGNKIYYSKKEPEMVKEYLPGYGSGKGNDELAKIYAELEKELAGASEEKKKLIRNILDLISKMDDADLEAVERLLERLRR